MERDAEAEFIAFARAESARLLRAAVLLTGDRVSAEDMLQVALSKTWSRWERVRRVENPEGYVRKILLREFLSARRKISFGVEVPTRFGRLTAPVPITADEIDRAVERRQIIQALQDLPGRQRAVIVLRYFADLTEYDTAQTLGCSVGAVKSQHARALKRLRTHRVFAVETSG